MTKRLHINQKHHNELESYDSIASYQPTDSNSMIDSMIYHMTVHQSQVSAIEERRLKKEEQFLQMKIDEKQRDRALAERIANIKVEERLKDRLSAERIAQMKLDHFINNNRQVIVHESQPGEKVFSYIERRPNTSHYMSILIISAIGAVVIGILKTYDITEFINFF